MDGMHDHLATQSLYRLVLYAERMRFVVAVMVIASVGEVCLLMGFGTIGSQQCANV